ncbi:uncharacterized protein DSM5745_09469 [Aspergillus mulundensis]|uniref:Uncharacterized protein n=1 Tax=Aspergillus mulundensis TaxID=1810919 RepID=A0A3D8QVP6_9EURO|nr:hypothetical protein DSM5745_09469 [Aspergillus mulundensis]RDW65730.1 hypothetical protein DSM5745_09469 [Aspergillus mulundensis]
MLSNNIRLPPASEGGSGPWVGDHGVRILNPATFTEAIMMLWIRERAVQEYDLASMWAFFLQALCDYPGGSGVQKNVRPKFKDAWDRHNGRGEDPDENVWDALIEMRDRLACAGELGPLVDPTTWQPPAL